MNVRVLPNRLILYRDTSSSFVKIGWATELIEDRFDTIELICETDSSSPVLPESPCYDEYQAFCLRARNLNQETLEIQRQRCKSEGWYSVSLKYELSPEAGTADEFGCFIEAARDAMYRLCGNDPLVWAAVSNQLVTQVRSQIPPKDMEALEYQVWRSSQLQGIKPSGGNIQSGELVALECGLWFRPIKSGDIQRSK